MDELVLFRMGERITLTLVVLIVAFVVMVGFWRSVQHIRLHKGEAIGFGGTVMFSTPVFVLLTIVGYAYVSLSHPITLTGPTASAEPQTEAAVEARPAQFIGMEALTDEERLAEFTRVQNRIRSLNCLAKTDNPRISEDVIAIKFTLLEPVWDDTWGNQSIARDWARGFRAAPPDPAFQAVFEDTHLIC